MSGVVYFVQAGGAEGPIKIGYTAGPIDRRIYGLQTASPVALTLLGQMAGTPEIEASLHKRFAALRLRGEWFEAHSDILALVGEHPSNQTKRWSLRRDGPCTQVAVEVRLVDRLKKIAAANNHSIVCELDAALRAHLEKQGELETSIARG